MLIAPERFSASGASGVIPFGIRHPGLRDLATSMSDPVTREGMTRGADAPRRAEDGTRSPAQRARHAALVEIRNQFRLLRNAYVIRIRSRIFCPLLLYINTHRT